MKASKNLSVRTSTRIPDAAARTALAVCAFTDEPHLAAATHAAEDDARWREVCEQILTDGEFKGEAETAMLVHARTADATHRILLVGLGERADFDAHVLRRASAVAARKARAARVRQLSFLLPAGDGGNSPAELARALAEGAHLGLYENDFYKKSEEDGGDSAASLEELVVVTGESKGLDEAFERARIVAESVNWARMLADEPGLSLPPREFARRAAEMAGEFGLRVESLDAQAIRAQGMGGLIGVGQGSDEEPALIVIRYEPEGGADDESELLAFVGKGITFDTGGISLKKPPGMEEMKSDMAGGAAALAALRAIAQLKPRRRVAAIVPSAENMPSSRAIKPGDIVKTLAGYNVEVVDTDAEGRLVLIDGIAYAKQLGATRIVDLATLTGSIIIALGAHRTGLFSNDDAWADEVRRASERAGEPLWRMPYGDDYKKLIESMIADFKNYGGRPDATGAALLLSKFAGETPWAHLDIAGTAWYDAPTPYAPKGSSGAGVRTLVELACTVAAQ
ncbi:MAG TPA: leucyl aminopeptidase [Pyrinomonadaceae bacterium]|nr:leucyl aminopeptidase [Pyrinomonadaceae bacterium]